MAKTEFRPNRVWPNDACVCGWFLCVCVVCGVCVVCEGSGDVVGVFTLLVGGVAQAFHDDRVVELRVQFVDEAEGKDGEE